MQDNRLSLIESIPLVGPIWAETILTGVALADALNLINLRRELQSGEMPSVIDQWQQSSEEPTREEPAATENFPRAA